MRLVDPGERHCPDYWILRNLLFVWRFPLAPGQLVNFITAFDNCDADDSVATVEEIIKRGDLKQVTGQFFGTFAP